ncbi:hypothetical protein GWK47_031221 [Chionoecetes opilio]|uniref:Uncharacterized protein n=1 Tax=Chionoecetes opilio TaxID=41210 RepID=A0A8J4Z109_CHIOP|nr:hypothetical protein GWK47_031221 [Chionoecetes opilio]
MNRKSLGSPSFLPSGPSTRSSSSSSSSGQSRTWRGAGITVSAAAAVNRRVATDEAPHCYCYPTEKVFRMRAARWLSLSLALALTEAQGDFLMPGVRVVQLRPKRQGSAIMFPDSPFDPRPLPPSAPARPGFGDPEEGPDDVLEAPEDMDLNAVSTAYSVV